MKRNAALTDGFTRRGTSEVWEWDQNPKITIRPRRNGSGGLGYRVTFPSRVTGGRVVFLQGKSLEEAKEIARAKGREFTESRSTALILGDAEKIQAAGALRTLRSAGVDLPLDEVARRMVAAQQALKPHGFDVAEAANLLAFCLTASAPTRLPLVDVVKYAVERLAPAGGVTTLSSAIEEMVRAKTIWAEQGHLRPASIRDFRDRTGRISRDIGSLPLPEITKAIVLEWLKGLELSPRSRKNYRMVLGEILRFAVQKRYASSNPIEELTAFEIKDLEGQGQEAREPNILPPMHARALITAAFEHPELDLGGAVALGLFCGIRTEELKRLRWDAVRLDEVEPFVVIGADIAKKRRIRNVPIAPCAVAWLRAWPRPSGDGPVTRSAHANDYQKRFKKLCRFAGINWDQNAMRHSFGTYHFALLGNALETARLMGHRGDDTVLFAHYRALATKSQGEEYFSLMPPASGKAIVPFSA
jgi:integrase